MFVRFANTDYMFGHAIDQQRQLGVNDVDLLFVTTLFLTISPVLIG